METLRGDCNTVVREDARTRQENAKKTHCWWLVVRACVFLVVLYGGASFSVAFATECGAPKTCVVLTRTIGVAAFCRKPNEGGMSGYPLQDLSGYDYSCGYLKAKLIGSVDNCFYPTAMYQVGYFKWFWDGTYWRILASSGIYYTVGDTSLTPLPPVPGEIVSHNYVDVPKLYPHGCSDLPSQQPDQTPNPETGDQKCNQAPLN